MWWVLGLLIKIIFYLSFSLSLVYFVIESCMREAMLRRREGRVQMCRIGKLRIIARWDICSVVQSRKSTYKIIFFYCLIIKFHLVYDSFIEKWNWKEHFNFVLYATGFNALFCFSSTIARPPDLPRVVWRYKNYLNKSNNWAKLLKKLVWNLPSGKFFVWVSPINNFFSLNLKSFKKKIHLVSDELSSSAIFTKLKLIKVHHRRMMMMIMHLEVVSIWYI